MKWWERRLERACRAVIAWLDHRQHERLYPGKRGRMGFEE